MGPTVSVGKSVNWVGQCTKHELLFPKYNLFFILQLCLAPFFNLFPLSDLKYNLSHISRKIGFFSKKYRIFSIFVEKSVIFLDFLPIFVVKIVFMQSENRFFAHKSTEKSDFLFINRNIYYANL